VVSCRVDDPRSGQGMMRLPDDNTQCTASAVGAADDLFATFKKSTIRRVLIDVESSHLLDSEK
jgi:hypothetical protein